MASADSPDLKKAKADLATNPDEDLAGTTSGDDMASAGPDDLANLPATSISGHMKQNALLGDGTAATTDVDLTDTTFAVLLPNATGWDAPLTGAGTASGNFTVANVPDGAYYLEVQRSGGIPVYYVTDARDIDLSFAFAGRADTGVAHDGTKLNLNLTLPTTWDATWSSIQFYSANAGAFDYSLDATTATTFSGKTANGVLAAFDGTNSDDPWLVDAAAGDKAMLIQLSHLTAGTFDYVTPSGFLSEIPTFTIADTMTTDVGTSGSKLALTSVTADNTLGATKWDLAAFTGAKSKVNSAATVNVGFFSVQAQPASITEWGIVEPNPYVLDTGTSATTAITLSNVKYANPYPAGWSLYGSAIELFDVAVKLSGTTTAATVTASVGTYAPLASFTGTIGKPLDPVSAAKIDSTHALTTAYTVADINNTTITWTASTGATYYEVYPLLLGKSGSTTTTTTKARLVTTDTSVKLPPGTLVSGSTYLFIIRAYVAPMASVKTKPELIAGTYGWADFVSAQITAP